MSSADETNGFDAKLLLCLDKALHTLQMCIPVLYILYGTLYDDFFFLNVVCVWVAMCSIDNSFVV